VLRGEGGSGDVICDRECVLFERTPIPWEGFGCGSPYSREDRVENIATRLCSGMNPILVLVMWIEAIDQLFT
jgi:hypothetical protein